MDSQTNPLTVTPSAFKFRRFHRLGTKLDIHSRTRTGKKINVPLQLRATINFIFDKYCVSKVDCVIITKDPLQSLVITLQKMSENHSVCLVVGNNHKSRHVESDKPMDVMKVMCTYLTNHYGFESLRYSSLNIFVEDICRNLKHKVESGEYRKPIVITRHCYVHNTDTGLGYLEVGNQNTSIADMPDLLKSIVSNLDGYSVTNPKPGWLSDCNKHYVRFKKIMEI